MRSRPPCVTRASAHKIADFALDRGLLYRAIMMMRILFLNAVTVSLSAACLADPDSEVAGADASIATDELARVTDEPLVAESLAGQVIVSAPAPLGVTLGVNAPLVSTRRPTIEFRPAGGATSFHCRFDNGAFVPCTASSFHTSPQDLADGWHTFQVYVRSGSSQSSPARWLFRIDATRPVVTFGPDSPSRLYSSTQPFGSAVTAQFHWATSEPVAETYWRTRIKAYPPPPSPPWEPTVAGTATFSLSPGYYLGSGLTYVIEVGVRDEAGNWGYATWTLQVVTLF